LEPSSKRSASAAIKHNSKGQSNKHSASWAAGHNSLPSSEHSASAAILNDSLEPRVGGDLARHLGAVEQAQRVDGDLT